MNSEVMEPEVWRPQVPGQGSGQQGGAEGREDPTRILSLLPRACPLPSPADSPSGFVISGDFQPDQELGLTCCHPLQTRLCWDTRASSGSSGSGGVGREQLEVAEAGWRVLSSPPCLLHRVTASQSSA